ncbi:uncharacterized protein EV154DRAFT_517879 [Mucor mucedo]|uniref:uncharacterized protein n=1 Tax=Mucor mucedo TaxID=29922 RepID=UPI002220D2DC|nr:uncharacterized protein EV154DRAFT_517879 [Mucor mucedo]KAI7888422.1 hypothetical protein EV154DRAFT_517879 [Mucor mucedo]
MSDIPSRKIVIAYDQSIVGIKVLEWINDHHILLPNDDVTVVLAINEDYSRIEGPGGWQAVGGSGGVNAVNSYREAIRVFEREGQEHLNEALFAIVQTGVKNVKSEILRGHAAEEITKYARAQHPDIVICGNRGNGYLKRKLLGSVSEYLTHHLDCTVMVVRAPNK